MSIIRSIKKHGNLLPAAYNAINSIPDELVFSKLHNIRHPKSAYSTSIRLIADQWCIVMIAIEKLKSDYFWTESVDYQNAVVREHKKFLYVLNEHFDACFSVLRSICAEENSKATSDAQYLGALKPSGWKSFRSAIHAYREDHLGYLVNRMKHHQAELSPICFKSKSEFRPGYFLCDLLPEGIMGPNHKLHSGGHTAFSYARDMLFHLWWIYRIGELLEQTIIGMMDTRHGFVLKSNPKPDEAKKWVETIQFCAAVKPEYFPDELTKPNVRVLLSNDSISLEYSNNVRGFPFLGDYSIANQFVVDGAYPTMKMPYFNRRDGS
jgi:hypothetical protein